MADPKPYTLSRVPVPPEPLLAGAHPDYADTFQLTLAHPDGHTAEEWMRVALTQSSPGVRRIILLAHRRVARFSVSSDPGSILGWQTLSSTSDVLHIATGGPLLRAQIVARRGSPVTVRVSTFLLYEKRRRAALIWWAIGPLHRRIAPYLLRRAASQLAVEHAA